MDTSKKYIKMCEKAEEVQKLWKPKIADVFVYDWVSAYGNRGSYCDEDGEDRTNRLWLPRQDQLQEIAPAEEIIANFNEFCFWLNDYKMRCINSFDSMEQLWLAFVMKEKYNKTWKTKKWISHETM